MRDYSEDEWAAVVRASRAAKKQKSEAAIYGGCLGVFGGIFTGPWLLMLALGALHHDVDARVPALGYWTVFLIVLGVSCVFGIIKRAFK